MAAVVSGITSIDFKKCTTRELQVKFYLGQNEACSPGDSTSGSPESLLQRHSGGRSVYKILVKGGVQCNQELTLQKAFC